MCNLHVNFCCLLLYIFFQERTRASLLEQVVNELITKNERLVEDETLIELNDSPQKGNGFLSTFRSAWHRNGRSPSNASNNCIDTLKVTKNLGQSLSLNDLTLLETEDGKKDVGFIKFC